MHLEILVEDQSGKRMLDILVPKILDAAKHTFVVRSYKGIGKIPKNMRTAKDAAIRQLLDQLPRLIQGYGKTFAKYPNACRAALLVVCDLDQRCLKAFRTELLAIVDHCSPSPLTAFCIAVEEGEAWLLGDMNAVKTAYPQCRQEVLDRYQNDSVCGTWEKLADAVCNGGAEKLSAQGYCKTGEAKSSWAEHIAPHMDVELNLSPSFRYFRDKLRDLAQ